MYMKLILSTNWKIKLETRMPRSKGQKLLAQICKVRTSLLLWASSITFFAHPESLNPVPYLPQTLHASWPAGYASIKVGFALHCMITIKSTRPIINYVQLGTEKYQEVKPSLCVKVKQDFLAVGWDFTHVTQSLIVNLLYE